MSECRESDRWSLWLCFLDDDVEDVVAGSFDDLFASESLDLPDESRSRSRCLCLCLSMPSLLDLLFFDALSLCEWLPLRSDLDSFVAFDLDEDEGRFTDPSLRRSELELLERFSSGFLCVSCFDDLLSVVFVSRRRS